MSIKYHPIITNISDSWKDIMDEYSNDHYSENSYYSLKVEDAPHVSDHMKDKMKNTRIIALNTQACYILNFMLLGARNDPGEELGWLESTLKEMEKNGEVGIIMGHHPPHAWDCQTNYASRYNILLERYQHLIRG